MSSKVRRRKILVCPKCQSGRGVPVVYGMPGPELVERARRGEVVLGGCCVQPGIEWECASCGHEWGIDPDVGRCGQ